MYYLLVTLLVTNIVALMIHEAVLLTRKRHKEIADEMIANMTILTELKLTKDNKVVIALVVKKDRQGGINFFDALRWVNELNKRLGTSVRLIGHKTAEALLATDNYNDELRPYSPFWTDTLIVYGDWGGKEICAYHHPDGNEMYKARFPTEQFCGNINHAFTIERISLKDFKFISHGDEIIIKKNGGQTDETYGFPDHSGYFHIDCLTGVPSLYTSGGRKLRLLRREHPQSWEGGWESEAMNYCFDSHIAPVVRSAQLYLVERADEIFAVHNDFYDRFGVVIEINEKDLLKLKQRKRN